MFYLDGRTIMVHSKLQHNVLKSYKALLAATKGIPDAQHRIRAEFLEGKSIRRMDIQNIEYKLRYASRRLEKLENDNVTNSNTFIVDKITIR